MHASSWKVATKAKFCFYRYDVFFGACVCVCVSLCVWGGGCVLGLTFELLLQCTCVQDSLSKVSAAMMFWVKFGKVC